MHVLATAVQQHPLAAVIWMALFGGAMFATGWGACGFRRDRAEGRFAEDPLELGGNSSDPEERVTVAIKVDTFQFTEAAGEAIESATGQKLTFWQKRVLPADPRLQGLPHLDLPRREAAPAQTGWISEGDWATAAIPAGELPDPAVPVSLGVDVGGDGRSIAIGQRQDGSTKFWTAPLTEDPRPPRLSASCTPRWVHRTPPEQMPLSWLDEDRERPEEHRRLERAPVRLPDLAMAVSRAGMGFPIGSTEVFSPGRFTGSSGELDPLPDRPPAPSLPAEPAAPAATLAAPAVSGAPAAPEPATEVLEAQRPAEGRAGIDLLVSDLGVPDDAAADFDALIASCR